MVFTGHAHNSKFILKATEMDKLLSLHFKNTDMSKTQRMDCGRTKLMTGITMRLTIIPEFQKNTNGFLNWYGMVAVGMAIN